MWYENANRCSFFTPYFENSDLAPILKKNLMRKKYFLLIFWTACFQLCLGENQSTIDSLLNVLPTTKEDTNRAKVLINLSKLYFQSDPEKCFSYAQQALTLAQKLDYKKCIIR